MIVAFGNPVYDYIKTPTLTTGERVLSGCSTNGCLALARLGHQTALVGRVGPDYYQRYQRELQRYGVQAITQLCEQTGGFNLIYDHHGGRTLDVLGVAEAIETVPPECAAAQVVVVGPILQETSFELIEQLRNATSAPLFLDPQGLLRRIGPHHRIEHFFPPELAQVAALFHVIKANELETKVITGIDPRCDGAEAARRLKALGCAIAIVTLAEAGSIIYDGQTMHRIPAFPTQAHDPTGAGDTYMAGFIDAYLGDSSDLYRAGCYGAAAASIWIEYTGPNAPLGRDELERRAIALLRLPRR